MSSTSDGQAPGQTEIGVPPQPKPLKYTAETLPKRVDFGASVKCPRCKGLQTKRKSGYVEPLTLDPHKKSQVCPRCDGFGIIPNVGV